MSLKSAISFAALLLQLAASGVLTAQIRSGTVTGSVKDASGAVVAGAALSLSNQETGIEAKSTTGESGLFNFPYLASGTYTLTISAPGFVTFRETGILIATAQTARVDAVLKLSAVETTVEVAAEAARIQTES